MPRLFDGNTSNYLLDPTHSPVAQPPCTMAAWFYVSTLPTVAGDEYGIIGTTLSSGFDSMYLRIDDDTTDGLQIVHRNSVAASAKSAGTISVDTWHHACGVFTSNASRTVYTDGADAATDTTTVSSMSDNVDWFVGAVKFSTAGDPFDGEIAHAAIWNVALTEDEVIALAQGAHPMEVRPNALVAYVPLHATETGDAFNIFGGSNFHLEEQGTVGAGVAGNPPVRQFLLGSEGSFGGDAAGGGGETLLAETGTYTTTGQDTSLLQTFNLLSEQGTYTITGQNATIGVTETLLAETGTYTLTGLTATLSQTYLVTAEQGTITFTGQDANITSPSPTLTAETGTYAIVGQDAVIRKNSAAGGTHNWDSPSIGVGIGHA